MSLHVERHLEHLLGTGAGERRTRAGSGVAGFDEETVVEPGPPPELGGHDYAILLLRTAAQIEHSLMVQYLFAAYSLDRLGAPAALRVQARAWQETILGIAKEEMAHLVTVQNLLVALGGPLCFERDDYPHTSPFYPFGFTLRPASLASLAGYVCAESPESWDDPDTEEIKQLAQADTGAPVNRVGVLYAELSRVLADPTLVPDGSFDAAGVPVQAGWDEWGRGYREGQRGREPMGALPDLPAPELLILTAASRADALAAVRAIGEQGEAFETPADDDQSHFRRFLAIYRAMRELGDDLAAVVRPVATNPTTAPVPDSDATDSDTATPLRHPEALLWGHLFNVRYRKLLAGLAHAFDVSNAPGTGIAPGPRGALVHRCFVEMYQLRAIAGLLVALPLDSASPDGPRAGPPFQMPYTLALPHTERDRWRLHVDLVDASTALLGRLKELGVSGDAGEYLPALAQADEIERNSLVRLVAGATTTPDGGPTP